MKNIIHLIVCCLLIRGFNSASVFEILSNLNDESNEDETAEISCKCGVLDKEMKNVIDRKLAERILDMIFPFQNSSIALDYPDDFVRLFKVCSVCEISSTKCHGNPKDFDTYYCIKSSAMFRGGGHKELAINGNAKDFNMTVMWDNSKRVKYPIEIDIPIGDKKKKHRRPRQVSPCAYPASLQTAELKCKIYPSSIKCQQKCAVGYTLRQGVQVMRRCSKKDNAWKPSNFEECRPYIDCSLTLLSGGSKVCSTPTTSEGVHCRIKCESYEDKLATGSVVYSCDKNGKWTPRLPFCVQYGSGLDLVPKPHRNKKAYDYYVYEF